MKQLGYIDTSCLSPSEKEQLQEDLKGVAVCLNTDYDFKAFGDIDSDLDPDYDLEDYKEDPYFNMLKKQYTLIKFIESECARKFGDGFISFYDIQDYLETVDDWRVLDDSHIELIYKFKLNKKAGNNYENNKD